MIITRGNLKKTLSFFIGVAFFLAPFTVSAQTTTPQADPATTAQNLFGNFLSKFKTADEATKAAVGKYLEATITPEHPGPHEQVTISIVSNLTDLKKAQFSWYINNKLQESSTGSDQFTFETGAVGETQVVDLVIHTFEGARVDKQFAFHPVNVDLLWEAQTYTPPFYKGRSLISPESTVKIVAMTDFVSGGSVISPKDLVFTWKENSKIIEGASGYGKNVFYTTAPKPYGTLNISVDVSSTHGTLVGSKTLSVGVSNPKVVLYEKSPLEGVLYNGALGSLISLSSGSELNIQAEPYFISPLGAQYDWYMNSALISSGQRSLLVRNEENPSGASALEMVARNTVNTFQVANSSVRVEFENSGGFRR